MSSSLYQRTNSVYNSQLLPWTLIVIGIILRVSRFLINPSLWFDEAGNALIIITQSFSQFMTPSPLGQSIPLGFSVLEKLAVLNFGNSEYALRSVALISGVSSLFLFYMVAKHHLKHFAFIIALSLFAILDPLVALSSELKPYASDLAICLLIYLATIYIKTHRLSALSILAIGAIGVIAVWFSHPSVFVLTGVGLTITIALVISREWSRLMRLLYVFSIWTVGFASVYFLYTRNLMADIFSGNNDLFYSKAKAFMPLPPSSAVDLQWFLDVLFRTFNYPVGLYLSGIAGFTFLVGSIVVYREKKEAFFLLMSPILLTLLFSGFRMYPFVNEPILFLVPLFIIFTAAGIGYIRDKLSQHSFVTIILAALLFIHPVALSAYHLVKPDSPEEIKSVLRYIKDNWQTGDIIYVYYMTQFAFEYYSKYHPDNYRFDQRDYIIGRGPRDWYATYKKDEFKGFWDNEKPFSQPYTSIFQEYVTEINKLKGHKRVWFLFSSNVPKAGMNEEKFFIYHLETIGKQIDFFGKPNVGSVYLYDLSEYAF